MTGHVTLSTTRVNVISSWQQNMVLDTQTQAEGVVDGLVSVGRPRGDWLILQLS